MPTYYLQFSLPFSLCSVNVIYNITIRHWTDSLASLPKYVFIRKELYVIALFTSLYVKWTLWVSFLGPLGVETLAMLKTKRCIIDCCEWKMQQVDWLVCVASTNQSWAGHLARATLERCAFRDNARDISGTALWISLEKNNRFLKEGEKINYPLI